MNKQIEQIEEKVQEHSLAMEILRELRMSSQRWFRAFISALAILSLTIAGFLIYLNQYDFTSTTTNEANGVYALIDSNGNVIAQDISSEQLAAFTEWWDINGIGKTNSD